jgi:hypothetical protein
MVQVLLMAEVMFLICAAGLLLWNFIGLRLLLQESAGVTTENTGSLAAASLLLGAVAGLVLAGVFIVRRQGEAYWRNSGVMGRSVLGLVWVVNVLGGGTAAVILFMGGEDQTPGEVIGLILTVCICAAVAVKFGRDLSKQRNEATARSRSV